MDANMKRAGITVSGRRESMLGWVLVLLAILCFILVPFRSICSQAIPTSYGIFAVQGDSLVPITKHTASSFVKAWLSEPARLAIQLSEWKPQAVSGSPLKVILYFSTRPGKLTIEKAAFGLKDQALVVRPLAGSINEVSRPGPAGEIIEVNVPCTKLDETYVLYFLTPSGDLSEMTFWSFGGGTSGSVPIDIQWSPFYCVTATGGNPNRTFIGTKGGVYSISGGEWQWLPLFDGNNMFTDNVRLLLCDLSGGDSLLCAVGDNGFYLSTESGKRWKRVPAPGQVAALCLDKHKSQRSMLLSLFSSTGMCEVARTLDGGNYWEWDWKFMSDDFVTSMAAGRKTLILGSTGGLHISYLDQKSGKEKFRKVSKSDLGFDQKWKFKITLREGLKIKGPKYAARQVFCAGDNDEIIMAEFVRDNGSSFVVYSKDSGESWQPLLCANQMCQVAVSLLENKFVIVMVDSTTHKYMAAKFADPQTQWEPIALPAQDSCFQFVCNPGVAGHYVVLTSGSNLQESFDYGQTWSNMLKPPFIANSAK
jgi:hypothetical protein